MKHKIAPKRIHRWREKCEKNLLKKKKVLLKDSTALLCYVVLTRHKSYHKIVVYVLFLASSLCPLLVRLMEFLFSSRMNLSSLKLIIFNFNIFFFQ